MLTRYIEVQVKRSVMIAYALAAVFVLVVVIALVARPIHYERTVGLGVVLALAAGAFGYARSRISEV